MTGKKRLRSGFTTGTAAAAAAGGAATLLLTGRPSESVEVTLPLGEKIRIVIETCRMVGNSAECTVIKDAGDDPDVTNKAVIGARVWLTNTGGIIIKGGEGVGKVTKPGLEVSVGRPAINPVPLAMIQQEVEEIFAVSPKDAKGIVVEIFVPEGEKLAKKTLNARLGIIGGISILGTTGIVYPWSHESYKATIKSALSVAKARGLTLVIVTTGRRSERYAQSLWPEMPEEGFIQIADFLKYSLCEAHRKGFQKVILAVFFGKAIKIAQKFSYTHAKKGAIDMRVVSEWAYEVTGDQKLSEQIMQANTARHILELIRKDYPSVISQVGERMVQSAKKFFSSAMCVEGIIFDYNGRILYGSMLKDKIMNPVQVIGIGLGPEDLTEKHREIIRNSDVLAGGRRHLRYFEDYPGEKLLITGNIQSVFEDIKKLMQNKKVVVIASGDPNFYGIGPSLVEYLGEENVVIHPNISVVAAAFSRIKIPWHDATVVSLHGEKPESKVLDAIVNKDKVAVFTDPEKTPAWLAQTLIEIGQDDLQLCVFENLGTPEEHYAWYSLKEIADKEFAALNIVVIMRTGNRDPQPCVPCLGMPEEVYSHKMGLITKTEVRAVTIARLSLLPHHVLWDLGAGSGSISIEASLLVREGLVVSIEKKPERVKQIEENIRQFQLTNIRVMRLRLPEGLEDLPRPDRIFTFT